eukprot:COSAG01_NODE_3863_length_5621_cov_2.450970_7_plen_92_part_00
MAADSSPGREPGVDGVLYLRSWRCAHTANPPPGMCWRSADDGSRSVLNGWLASGRGECVAHCPPCQLGKVKNWCARSALLRYSTTDVPLVA